MASPVGNPAEVRPAAMAKAASVGRGGFGPEPGRQGGKNTIQGNNEWQNRVRRNNEIAEAKQDRRERQRNEARSGVYGGANSGGKKSGTGAQGSPGYGSNRNYPQTV